jgi:hypothetical protein
LPQFPTSRSFLRVERLSGDPNSYNDAGTPIWDQRKIHKVESNNMPWWSWCSWCRYAI